MSESNQLNNILSNIISAIGTVNTKFTGNVSSISGIVSSNVKDITKILSVHDGAISGVQEDLKKLSGTVGGNDTTVGEKFDYISGIVSGNVEDIGYLGSISGSAISNITSGKTESADKTADIYTIKYTTMDGVEKEAVRISIDKVDKFLETVEFKEDTNTVVFTFNTGDTISANLTDLVDTYTAGSGISVTTGGVIGAVIGDGITFDISGGIAIDYAKFKTTRPLSATSNGIELNYNSDVIKIADNKLDIKVDGVLSATSNGIVLLHDDTLSTTVDGRLTVKPQQLIV